MKDLKNKLTEEQGKTISCDFEKWKISQDHCKHHECGNCCLYCYLKQVGIIRKSALEEAREKTDRLHINIIKQDCYKIGMAVKRSDFDDFIDCIQAEREAADKKE